MNVTIIQDNFRYHYRLHIPGDVPVDRFLEAKEFSDPVFTEDFVYRLRVPLGYWEWLLSRISAIKVDPWTSAEECISELLIQGILKLYPVKHLDR